MFRLLGLLALLLPRIVLARCGPESLSVWPPPGQPLPANGQIVLEGYGRLQEPVIQIAQSAPRLVAGKDDVPLRVIAVYRGEKSLTQAILQPERPLQPGQRYTLRLTKRKSADAPALPAKVWLKDKYTPMAWTVTSADTTPPRWREEPRKVGEHSAVLGCGPEAFVNVSARVDDEGSQVQVLAEVRKAAGGEPVRFRLTPTNEQVAVGHGMCSGAFLLENGIRYTVRLIAVDMAGNESPAPGDALAIEGPKDLR